MDYFFQANQRVKNCIRICLAYRCRDGCPNLFQLFADSSFFICQYLICQNASEQGISLSFSVISRRICAFFGQLYVPLHF